VGIKLGVCSMRFKRALKNDFSNHDRKKDSYW
jgi:hypothetical protein